MEKLTGKIGSVNISIEIPDDPKIGLSKHESLCSKCTMLFDFGSRKPVITMEKTALPLDIIFLNEDMVIVDIKQGEPNSKLPIMSNDQSRYVLETPYSFTNKYNISIGDSLKIDKKAEKGLKMEKSDLGDGMFRKTKLNVFTERDSYKTNLTKVKTKSKLQSAQKGTKISTKVDKAKKILANIIKATNKYGTDMFLLDAEGKPQMPMEGGERIFSRIHTKELLNLVSKSPSIENLVKLGSKMVEIIKKQDTQKPEYVNE